MQQTTVVKGWRMTGPGRIEWFEEPLQEPPPDWVTVEVLGCGVCHTDISYLYDGVPTAHKGPLVLGHEIVGQVMGTDRTVIVPAVSPCGQCAACRRGRRTACTDSRMPGNHHDGGFATHVTVPKRWLCDVPNTPSVPVWQLAVVADAVTTPYQAAKRAGLSAGGVAVIVGVGGVGGFLVQVAKALGASPVALDVADGPLARAAQNGAVVTLNVRGLDARAVKKEVAAHLSAHGIDPAGWQVFECSGSPPGQQLAYQLIQRGSTLSVIGFSPETIPLKLSMLMALDAEAYGNWGCDPVLYPEALELVTGRKVDLSGSVVRFPLADAPAVLEAAHKRELDRRAVLVPNG